MRKISQKLMVIVAVLVLMGISAGSASYYFRLTDTGSNDATYNSLMLRLAALQNQRTTSLTTIKGLQSDKTSLQADKAALAKQVTDLQQNLADLKNQNTATSTQLANIQSQIQQLTSDLNLGNFDAATQLVSVVEAKISAAYSKGYNDATAQQAQNLQAVVAATGRGFAWLTTGARYNQILDPTVTDDDSFKGNNGNFSGVNALKAGIQSPDGNDLYLITASGGANDIRNMVWTGFEWVPVIMTSDGQSVRKIYLNSDWVTLAQVTRWVKSDAGDYHLVLSSGRIVTGQKSYAMSLVPYMPAISGETQRAQMTTGTGIFAKYLLFKGENLGQAMVARALNTTKSVVSAKWDQYKLMNFYYYPEKLITTNTYPAVSTTVTDTYGNYVRYDTNGYTWRVTRKLNVGEDASAATTAGARLSADLYSNATALPTSVPWIFETDLQAILTK